MPPKRTAAKKPGKKASTLKTDKKGSKAKPGKTAIPVKGQLNSSKKVPTREDIAAVQIQKQVRRFLAKKQLKTLKERKKDYESLMEQVEKEAYASVVRAEQERAEKEREKAEEERKELKEKQKRVKRMLEAAFDGDVSEMDAVLTEVVKVDDKNRVKRDEMGQIVRRMHILDLVECADLNDNTALSEAATGGSTDAIKFLVERGADVNSVGHYGRTPLYRATFAGHLSAVEMLLQYGADPRIYAQDSNTPAQIASVDEIQKTLESWDISITEQLMQKLEVEKSRRQDEVQKRKDDAEKQLKNGLDSAEKEYRRVEQILIKCYCEMEKRISEHDQMVVEGNTKMAEITLKTVKNAEDDVAAAKSEAEKARGVLENIRLELRNNQNEGKDLPGMNCNIRELEEVVFKDVGNKIKTSGHWPLLIDTTGQATVFLRYRDTNMLTALNPADMQPETIRKALIGAIRFGKPLVIDFMEVDMFEQVSEVVNRIQPKLMKQLMTKALLKDEKYMKLVKNSDDAQYQAGQFMHHFVENFKVIFITKNPYPPKALLDQTYPIRVVLPK